VQEDLAPVLTDAPGGENRLARLACPKPLGDAVHEQVHHPIFVEVAGRERLVLGPQPLGDLADGGAAQQSTARFVRERVLDVPRRQPTRIELDREILERSGAARQVLANARNKRLGRRSHLWRRKLHHPLRRLHPSRSVAVAVPARLAGSPLVAIPANLVPHLAFASSRISCAARSTRLDRSGAVPSRPSIKARSRSRVLSGADTLFIGMLPAGPRRQPAARFLKVLRQGASQLPFPANLRLHH
jgi:hypothetical protein